jgi:hypothetical protein
MLPGAWDHFLDLQKARQYEALCVVFRFDRVLGSEGPGLLDSMIDSWTYRLNRGTIVVANHGKLAMIMPLLRTRLCSCRWLYRTSREAHCRQLVVTGKMWMMASHCRGVVG